MSIYWFETHDGGVIHAILAPNEKEAQRILSAIERDVETDEFELAGVSPVGQAGGLAIIVDRDLDVYDEPKTS